MLAVLQKWYDASQQVNCDNDDYKEFVHRKSANMFVCFLQKTIITKAVSPYTIYRDKKQHHSTYCTVTEYKLT